MSDHDLLTFTTGPRVLRDYYVAASVDEALAYLMSHQGDAQLVAGGTTLMPRVQQGVVEATCLVDVSRIGALRRAKLHDPYLVVGGAMTMAQMLRDPLLAEHAPLLKQAAAQMATPQVRRLATLAGSLVAALGSSPIVTAMVTLDAQIEIANTTGSQWLPYRSTIVRAGLSRVDSTSEIVTAARFAPLAAEEGMAVGSLPSRAKESQPELTIALVLGLAMEGHQVEWCSCAYGCPDHVPDRETEIEERLVGSDVDSPATTDALAGLLVRAMEDDPAPAPEPGLVHDLVERVYACAVDLARREPGLPQGGVPLDA